MTGVLSFLLAIVTAFTGFLMMTNWDSQFISQQAKDAFNAMGIGAVWNVMNVGQQFTMHVVVTAGLLGFVVLVHLGQIRRRGVAPPPGEEHLEVADDASPAHQGRHLVASATDAPEPAVSGAAPRGDSNMSRRPPRHPIRHWSGSERKYDLLFEGHCHVN